MKQSSSSSLSTSTSSSSNREEQQQKVHNQPNNFIEYLLGHGEFSTDVVFQLTEMVSLNQMSSVVSTCQELNNANLTLYVPPNEWTIAVDVRKIFTIMLAKPMTKWIGRIDTSKVTKIMFWSTWFSDSLLCFIASGKFPLLASLACRRCNNITETGITELVRGCPQITTLDFTYCDWVTDASVTRLSSEFTQLTALNLCGCDITDASIHVLLNECPQITTLGFSRCNKITSVIALSIKFPQITALDFTYCDWDVISCFPYDFISPPEQTGQGIARLPKLIRLLRLAKIAKVLRMSRILRRFESSMHIKYGIVRLTKFFLWSLVAAHWVGCAWFIIGTLDTYEGWVVSNLLTTELHGASVGEQYIASVYWSGKCGFDTV